MAGAIRELANIAVGYFEYFRLASRGIGRDRYESLSGSNGRAPMQAYAGNRRPRRNTQRPVMARRARLVYTGEKQAGASL